MPTRMEKRRAPNINSGETIAPAVPLLKLSKGMIPILVRIPETRAPKKIHI